MAKTKKENKESKNDTDNNIEELILKEFGDIITNADYVKGLRNKIIPVTPKLDIILGGGIPEGCFTILTGPPKVGKSSLSLQIAANAQKLDENRTVYYFDIEGRIKERDLFGNKGLNLDKDRFKLIQSKQGNILTGDKFIDIGEKLINSKPGCIFIFDSFSALCTQSRFEANISDRFRDDAPLLLASFCKRIAQVVAINKSIILGITHRIANQSGMGHSQWMEASGQKLQYQADCKLAATHFSPWKDSTGNTIGQQVFWKIPTCPLGSPGETDSWLRFNYGYDDYTELIEIASDIGIITKKGAWYNYNDHQGQGLEKTRAIFIDNPDLFIKLKEQVYAIYKK